MLVSKVITHVIRLSDIDVTILNDLVSQHKLSKNRVMRGYAAKLSRILESAGILKIGNAGLIDAVALNTSARFKNLSVNEDKEYLLVVPQLECKELGRLSILSEIGVYLLGHKKGETVEIKKVNGKQYSVQIIDVNPVNLDWIKRLKEQS